VPLRRQNGWSGFRRPLLCSRVRLRQLLIVGRAGGFFVSEVLALHGKVKSKNCDRIISSGMFVGVKRPARPALC
jgi:hypothetical protein